MKRLISYFCVLLTLSCSESSPDDHTIRFDKSSRMLNFKEVGSVTLESDSVTIGAIDKLHIYDDSYFVIDRRYSKNVWQFTKDGKFIKSFVKHGGGPFEIQDLFDFYIYNSELYILGRTGGRIKIIKHDLVSGKVFEYYPYENKNGLVSQIKVDAKYIYLAKDNNSLSDYYITVLNHDFRILPDFSEKSEKIPEVNKYVNLGRRQTTGFIGNNFYYAGIYDHYLFSFNSAKKYDFGQYLKPYDPGIMSKLKKLNFENKFTKQQDIIEDYGYLVTVLNDGHHFFVIAAGRKTPFLYNLQERVVYKINPDELINKYEKGIMVIGPIAFKDSTLYFYERIDNTSTITMYRVI